MYNTVLGARPMHTDGRAFYYADYNFAGHKVYSNHIFPCCSGTLPQVAADYRINTWFHDNQGIYVNLYVPSSVRWVRNGWLASLRQSGEYPFENSIHFELLTSAAKEFAINFRIPQWAAGARIEVNGKGWPDDPQPGTFARISRLWRSGDRIDLDLPRKMRLEPVSPSHPDTVALLCGPLVLFPVGDIHSQAVTRSRLLSARKIGPQLWESETQNFLPYVAINDEQYATYLQVSG